jgi:hypothetical protein
MRRRWLAGIFAVSAVWAILVAVVSNDHNHKIWGMIAAFGYGLAVAVILLVRHARAADLALWLAFVGGLVLPLGYLAARHLYQPEVHVVAQSAQDLIHHGTPYMSQAALRAAGKINDYNPYLPLMALFGLPTALFGFNAVTDPRVWFGLVFLAVFWLALRKGGARDPGRWVLLVAASPVIAFELAVGGTDVPMVAFLCLGFAFLWDRKPLLAGLALGIGSSMKATAWPALLVTAALLWVTMSRRAVRDFALAVIAVLVVCVGPILITNPRELIFNTIKFPLGLAGVESDARSPLPGYLIADLWGRTGHTIVVALLVLAALAVAVSLVARPPRTVPRAVLLLSGAMTLMFVLAPSTRVGYFIYPATLAIWLFAAQVGRRAVDDELGEIEVDFLPACVPEGPPVT